MNSIDNIRREEAKLMYKTVLLGKNGRIIEFFVSPKVPTVKHKKNHMEIRGKNLARKTFILIVSRHNSAKIEFIN